jgi:tetratricopeptide (TPR) repeat protein
VTTKIREFNEMPAVQSTDYLRLAMASEDPREALRLALEGLARADEAVARGAFDDAEARFLLLREVFKAHLRSARPRSALAIAKKMTRLGVLSEVAHADYGRACAALGRFEHAARSYRLAARFAPANRRATHWSATAMALWNAGLHDEALAALERALRWSTHTRPLHRAQHAMVELSRGRPTPDLSAVIADLDASRAAEGYGRFVLGMIAHLRGENAKAQPLLAEFVARNSSDPMRAATLAGELAKAREVLALVRSVAG